MQITVASSYLPPSDKAIQAAASEAQLKLKVPDFVRDVCNIAAGGRFLSPSEISAVIQEEWDKNPARRDFKGNKNRFIRNDNNAVYDTFTDAYNSFVKDKDRLATKVRDTIGMMQTMDVPGNNPLEQSVNLISLLLKQRYGSSGSGSGKEATDDVLDELLDRENIAKAKDNLNTAANLSQSEKDLLDEIASIKDEDIKKSQGGMGGKGVGDGTLTGHTAQGRQTLKYAMQLSDKRLEHVLRISRKMKSFSKLRTSKIQEFTPDAEGNEVRNRAMTNFGELPRIRPAQYAQKVAAPGLFTYKSVTNQLMIRERGKYLEKKQLLYVLVDCSGSMTEDNYQRINMAAGVLVNRLMAVTKGDACVYWRFFDTRVYDVTYVDTKEKARESISKIMDEGAYKGGGTNFDVAIKRAVEHIIELKEETSTLAKPEIFMVTDGGCSCNLKRDDLKGIKLHAGLVADEYSSGLHNLVGATGGAYINFCE